MSRDARAQIAELEGQITVAKIMARRFWRVLATSVDVAAQALFVDDLQDDARRVVDVAFDAAQIVWAKHRVLVQPCRRLLDQPCVWTAWSWPSQDEMYLATYPGGDVRNLSRGQLLMMAGMDEDA
jgi:hypothetical protein